MDEFFLNSKGAYLGYKNVRDLPHHDKARKFISYLWNIYKPFADPHFREDAKNHFLQRFWEMYLTVTLIEHGYEIHRTGHEGPEFYIEQNNKRIWVEAIAPGPGEGADQVPEPKLGVASEVPIEKILLRFTHALAEKRKKCQEALNKQIMLPDDAYLLAINCRAIPHAPYGNTMPYYIQAFLLFGPYTVSIDTNTGDIVDSFYRYREAVPKLNRTNIPTTAFLDAEFGCISAVLNSSVDCVNRPEILGGDFSILHNPRANQRIDQSILNWCKQYSLSGDELITNEPNHSLNQG